MAHITDLPLDMFNVIFVMIAMSDDGARDLARAGATCRMFMDQAFDSRVLRVVNFQYLTNTIDFMNYHHVNNLLCMCALSKNRAAQIILAKAHLIHDTQFWDMILLDYQRSFYRSIFSSLVLDHHSLVRTFILHATSQDIAEIGHLLIKYVFEHVGYGAALYAIINLYSYETMKFEVSRSTRPEQVSRAYLAFDGANTMVRLEPPHGVSYRDTAIVLFDKLFPSASG